METPHVWDKIWGKADAWDGKEKVGPRKVDYKAKAKARAHRKAVKQHKRKHG